MTKTSLLILPLALLTAGCATRTWTERTDETRPVGETRVTVENRALTDEYYEARTGMESDGFQWLENVNTDDAGEIQFSLLPAAVQCLYYGHDVRVELWSFASNRVEHTYTVTPEVAARVINEWSVQANLGADVPVKRATADLIGKLIGTTASSTIKQQLRDIRRRVTIRFDWE